MPLPRFPYTVLADVHASRLYGLIEGDYFTTDHSRPATHRKTFCARANAMRQVLLHPGMGVHFRLKAHRLARIFHDVFDGGPALTHYRSCPIRVSCGSCCLSSRAKIRE